MTPTEVSVAIIGVAIGVTIFIAALYNITGFPQDWFGRRDRPGGF